MHRRRRGAFVCRVKKCFGKEMQTSAAINVERLALSETYVSPKGSKTVQLKIDGDSVYWLTQPLHVNFEPRSFDGSEQSKVNLCLLSTPSVEAQAAALDQAVLALALANSVALFGKQLTEEGVRDRYSPVVYRKPPHPNMIRPKLVLQGRNTTKCWDADTKTKIEHPKTWKDSSVTLRILIKGLWLQGMSFGVSTEIVDALIAPQATECPW